MPYVKFTCGYTMLKGKVIQLITLFVVFVLVVLLVAVAFSKKVHHVAARVLLAIHPDAPLFVARFVPAVEIAALVAVALFLAALGWA